MRLDIDSSAASIPFTQEQTEHHIGSSPVVDTSELMKRGISAARSGERASARSYLLQVTDADPHNSEAWLWLASISEYPEELLGFLNNVLEIDPHNERALQWEAATRSLLAKTFVHRGMNAHADGQRETAIQCFDDAIEHDDRCEAAWFWKANLAGSEDERQHLLECVLEINPNHEEAREALNAIESGKVEGKLNAARAAAVDGDLANAENLLAEVLESDPDSVAAWTLQSQVSASLHDKLQAYRRMIEIEPENAFGRAGFEFLSDMMETENAPATAEEPEVVETQTEEPAAVSFVAPEPEAEVEVEVAAQPEEHLSFEEDEEEPAAVAETHTDSVEMQEFAKELNEEPVASSYPWHHQPEPAHESFTERYESVIPHEEADENIHEYLTQESYSVPEAVEPQPVDQPVEMTSEPAAEPEAVQFEEASPEPVEASYSYPAAVQEVSLPQQEEPVAAYSYAEAVPEVSEVPAPPSNVEINAELASYNPFESKADDHVAIFEQPQMEVPSAPEPVVYGHACPYCGGENESQAFSCSRCHAVLTMSDIELLLGDQNVDRGAVQQAVTQMEAEWNLREFSEQELTTLGIGHFNLKNYESGLAYLQEASRLNPNNVILTGQVNALAIRVEEVRRQEEQHDAMPKGKTILVVDDSATVRKLISSKLEKCGHNVICAVDGVEAIDAIKEVVPDLVLLDIAMPRMDGYSVCKLIRANDAAKHVPVVMISGKDGFFDKVRGRMAGTTGYITKPFGPETLMRALDTYLVPDEAVAE